MTSSILQFQFIEKGFKKTENVQHSLVLLLFLFTVEIKNLSGPKFCKVQSKVSYLTFFPQPKAIFVDIKHKVMHTEGNLS